MKPMTLRIEGIGPHADTSVNWDFLDSPAAICAKYGTGKTWLIEAITGCLYGVFPWYSGGVYEALTQGGSGEGSIELSFEHGGEVYTACRAIKQTAGGTRSQQARLMHNAQMIAGPKVGDFERAVTAMIGDADTALATWFLSQNRSGDLIGQPGEKDLVARRRAVFNELIGASALDDLERRAAEAGRAAQAEANVLDNQLAGDEDPAAIIDVERDAIFAETERLNDATRELASVRLKLRDAQNALRDASGGDDVLKAQINEFNRAQDAHAAAVGRTQELSAEADRIKAVADGISRAEQEAALRVDLLEKRTILKVKQKDYEKWQAWEQRRNELAASVTSLQLRVADLQAAPGVEAETEALAAQLDARSWRALEVKRSWLRGESCDDDLEAARDSACDAACDAAWEAARSEQLADIIRAIDGAMIEINGGQK